MGQWAGRAQPAHRWCRRWASFGLVDEHYERMRARLLAGLADHERGLLDHAGLQAAIADLNAALGNGRSEVREALFEADVALEYARFGHPDDGAQPGAALKRIRRNLREVLG
jgi:hypothetical protein